jgi:hypothetical protein
VSGFGRVGPARTTQAPQRSEERSEARPVEATEGRRSPGGPRRRHEREAGRPVGATAAGESSREVSETRLCLLAAHGHPIAALGPRPRTTNWPSSPMGSPPATRRVKIASIDSPTPHTCHPTWEANSSTDRGFPTGAPTDLPLTSLETHLESSRLQPANPSPSQGHYRTPDTFQQIPFLSSATWPETCLLPQGGGPAVCVRLYRGYSIRSGCSEGVRETLQKSTPEQRLRLALRASLSH